MRDLAGKRVLITGAGRGLGRALAFAFARAGAVPLVTDRDLAAVETTVAELRAAGLAAAGAALDVTDAEQVAALPARLHAEGGPIDVLVNNAGVVFGGPFLQVPMERHRATVAVNLGGLVAVTHAFLPDLIARPEAHLVNVASASAFVGLPWAATYAATKWAVFGFTESLRQELRLLGHRRVGVTVVCPAYIDTGLFGGVRPPRFIPLLTADVVAAAVVRAVRRGREIVVLPPGVRLVTALTAMLPWPLYRRVCSWLGVDTGMATWHGHAPETAQRPPEARG